MRTGPERMHSCGASSRTAVSRTSRWRSSSPARARWPSSCCRQRPSWPACCCTTASRTPWRCSRERRRRRGEKPVASWRALRRGPPPPHREQQAYDDDDHHRVLFGVGFWPCRLVKGRSLTVPLSAHRWMDGAAYRVAGGGGGAAAIGCTPKGPRYGQRVVAVLDGRRSCACRRNSLFVSVRTRCDEVAQQATLVVLPFVGFAARGDVAGVDACRSLQVAKIFFSYATEIVANERGVNEARPRKCALCFDTDCCLGWTFAGGQLAGNFADRHRPCLP